MKKCSACGHANWIRPDLKEDWKCEACNSIIEKHEKSKGNTVTDGCKVVPPKIVPYDDTEYF